MTLTHEFKNTFYLSAPIIIGNLGHMLMSVVDTAMVGRIGTVPLAAAAISNILFYLILVMGLGISTAVTPLTAIAFGAGENKKCGVILRQGLVVNMLCGVVLCVLIGCLAKMIKYMNQPPEIIAPAKTYLTVLGFSTFPIMFFQSYKQFAEGIRVIKSAMVISLVANIVNAFVNWVCIFGNLGVPPMGLTGAGMATFCSRLFMALAMFFVVAFSPKLKQYDPTLNYRKIDFQIITRLFKIGIPTGFQYLFEVSSFAGASIVIGWIGTRELAAHQIALNIASISYMISMGMAAAATVRVGTAKGQNDIHKARKSGFSAVALCTVIMTGCAFFFIMTRHILPSFYITDQAVIKLAAALLIIVGLFQIPDGAQAVGLGMLRGITDMRIPTLITFTAYWVVGIPVGYVLGITFGKGVIGVWIGLSLGLVASAVMLLMRFHWMTRGKQWA